jgi:predicted NBD/HSP70 family sugar kinase
MSASATATPARLRRINAAAVLDLLMSTGAVTGTEIMAATGLSRPTVHAACDQLIAVGLVRELDGRRPDGMGRPGRPARCYAFTADAGRVVGVDLGEWKITAMAADLGGRPLADVVVPLASNHVPARERLAAARTAIRDVLRASGSSVDSVRGICVGVAAAVRPDGRIYPSADPEYLPGLADVHLTSALGRGLGAPVLLDNDANLAVLAERWRGVAQDVDDVVLLLAGERLGAGIVVDGRLVRGAGGAAGELALLDLVHGVGDTHGIGAAARMAGERAVRRQRLPRHRAERGALYDLAAGQPADVTGELVATAARAGDPVADDILRGLAERTARTIGVLCGLLDPELVVIGGGVSDVIDLIHEHVVRELPPWLARPPRIEASRLGDAGVVTGAVRRALDRAHDEIRATVV